MVGITDSIPQALLYLGRSYHALGELEKAVRVLDSYVRLKPGSAAGRFFLGRAFLALGMYPEAVRRLREALKLNPRLSPGYGLLGFAYLKARQPERSVALFRKALELDPRNESLLSGYLNAVFVAAIRLFHRGRLVDSAHLFNEILRIRGSTIAPHLYLAAIYRELDKGNAALFHLDAASEIAPQDPLLHLHKSLALLEQGNKKAALEELRVGTYFLKSDASLDGRPDEILRFITVRLFTEGRYKEAIFYATKLLKGAYDDPRLHALTAEAYRNLGDLLKARNHYQRALEKDKESLEIRYGMLAVLWRLGEYKDLLSQCRGILQRKPSDDLGLYFRSLALAKNAETPEEAIKSLQERIHAKGPDPVLMSTLGTVYLKTGFPDLAEGWYLRTLKMDPNDQESLLSLAAIYQSRQNRLKEKEMYLRYLETHPQDAISRKVLVRILLGEKAFAEAAEQIIKLLPLEPKNTKLKSILALCYRNTGRYSEALIILKDLMRENPGSEEMVKAVAYCLDKLKARRTALQVVESFITSHGRTLSLTLMLGVLYFQEAELERSAEAFRNAISLSPKDWRAYRNLGMVYEKLGNHEFAETFLSRAAEYKKAADAH